MIGYNLMRTPATKICIIFCSVLAIRQAHGL